MINKNNRFFSSILTSKPFKPNIIHDYELKPIRPSPEELSGEILSTYGVKLAKIYIVKNRGRIRYVVEEPELNNELQMQIIKLIEYIYTTRGISVLMNNDNRAKIISSVAEELDMEKTLEENIGIIDYYIDRVLSGYGPLYPIINDPYVEEITCEKPYNYVAVFHRIYPDYLWIDTNVMLSEEELNSLVLTLARKAKVHVSAAFPYAEGLTEEGHRIAITYLKEISPHGSSFVIRKFPQIPLTIIDLIASNTLSPLEAAYLWTLIENQAFIMIIGGMASGKSVGKLSHLLIRQENNIRLVTIEDLWNNLVAQGYEVKRFGNMEVIENPNIEILTVTEKRVEWHKPKYLIRHRYVGKMYRVRTKTGKIIEVTPDHSLLIWKVGTEKDKFEITFEPVNPGNIGQKTYLPYLRLLEFRNHSRGSGKSADPRFGYLVGIFVAEGYFNGNTPRIHQSVGPILDHVIKYMNELGFSYHISPEKHKPYTRYIAIYDSEYKREVTPNKIGSKARTKRVPDIFWNMDEEWRSAFLAGIIDGDGSIHTGKYIIEIATMSEKLAYGLLYAFASVGVHAYLRTKRVKKYPGHVYYCVLIPIGINKEPLRKIMKWLSEEKRRMIEEAIEKSMNHHSETDVIPAEVAYAIGSILKRKEHGRDARLSFELRSYKYKGENPSFHRVEELLGEKLYEFIPRDVGFDEIVEVEEEDYEGYVYDIEVPETENFEVNGIFVHNTTMLQALLNLIPINSRIVTIEDTPELRLMHPHWDSLITRQTYSITPKGLEVTLFDLAKFALRRRAEYIVIGEVRGEEARVLAQAAATGQGSLCTFHADSVDSALIRLKSSPIELSEGFLNLIWCFIVMKRVKVKQEGYKRRVTEIVELIPTPKGPEKNTIFTWDPRNDKHIPLHVDEVVQKSYRLKLIANLRGLDREQLIKDLARREKFLIGLLNRNIRTLEEVFNAIMEFYSSDQCN